MPSINRAELIAALAATVRSNGEGGKTTAQDLRQFLTQLIDAIAAQDNEQSNTVISLDSIQEEMLAPDVREKLNSASGGVAVVQTTGTSEVQVMSQKAVTEALDAFVTNPANLVHTNRTRDYYATAAAAIAEAIAGDTLVLPAPVSDATIAGNEAQLFLTPGLSVHTEGFDVGSLLTAGDAITLVGGTGKIIGKNSRVFSNSDGAWGMGAYREAPPGMFYEIYDLHFLNRTTCAVIFNSDCDVHFYNCHFNSSEGTAVWGRLNNPRLYFHNCQFRITANSIAARLSPPVKMVFENCLILTQNRTITDHLIGDAQVGEIHLINTTVLAETPTTSAVKANTLILQGNTTINGLFEAASIVDQRPANGEVSSSVAPDNSTNSDNQQLTSVPNSYFAVGQSVEDDSADWVYDGNWINYNGVDYHNGNCHYLEVGASGVATLNKPAYCSKIRFTFGPNTAPRSSKLEIRKYGTTTWAQQGIVLKDGNEISLPELAYWEIRQKDNVPSDYTVVDFIEFL